MLLKRNIYRMTNKKNNIQLKKFYENYLKNLLIGANDINLDNLQKGINLIKLKLNNDKRFDLKHILKKLYLFGIRNLLIEGGNKLTQNVLENKLADQFYLFKSPKNISTNKEYITFNSNNILNKNYKIRSKISSKLAKDSITIYKR